MTYLDILEVWAAAAATADPTATYYRGRLSDISRESVSAIQTSLSSGGDKRNLIYAEDTQVATGQSDVNTTESWRVRFGFLRQDSTSSEAMEADQVQPDEESREVIFTKTLVIARKFIAALYDEDSFQITGTPTLTQVTRTLSGTFTGWGVDVNFVLPVGCEYDSPIQDAVYKNSDNTFTVSIKRAEVYTAPDITVTDSDGSQYEHPANKPVVCTPSASPAEAVLKNSAGTTISTTSIDPGTSQDIPAPDATAVLKDTDGATLSTTAIPSNTSADIEAPDGDITLQNSAGTTLGLTSVKSGGALIIVESDATAVVKDQNGNTLDTEAIPAGASEDIVITLPQAIDVVFNPIAIGNDTSGLWTNAGTTATFTSISDDGASGTITVSVNGGSYAAFANPTVITNGQTLQVKRTVTTGVGTVTVTGTYA